MEHSPDAAPRLPFLSSRQVSFLNSGYCLLMALVIAGPALADDRIALLTTLDGQTYQSKLGMKGHAADVDDLLVFEDGQFLSEECERRCGYARVEYWVRAQDDGIQMRADVPCTDSGAVMYWRGTIRDNEIEGSIKWINKRWYWTFEKELWFKGQLVEAQGP